MAGLIPAVHAFLAALSPTRIRAGSKGGEDRGKAGSLPILLRLTRLGRSGPRMALAPLTPHHSGSYR